MSNPKTISQYLDEQRVDLSTASVDECSRLDIVLTQPAGWNRAPETMFPHAAAVFFDDTSVVDGFAPNVVILVGALSRAVDAEELLSYGFNDSRALPQWGDTPTALHNAAAMAARGACLSQSPGCRPEMRPRRDPRWATEDMACGEDGRVNRLAPPARNARAPRQSIYCSSSILGAK